MKTANNRTPEQEVVAFLRSMLRLVERRGLSYVDPEFGFSMMAMATLILTPIDPTSKGAVNVGHNFLEEFSSPPKHSRTPVSVLKSAVLIVELLLGERSKEGEAPAEQERAA